MTAELFAALREEREAAVSFNQFVEGLLRYRQPFCLLAQGSKAWQSARVYRLTASNFAAAAGLNPHVSPRSLWQYLSGHIERWQGNAHTARGSADESTARAAY
jgi:hypothetical protein